MTIPEAVQLVLQAGFMGTGGEIFVFDMGEKVKIVDLAKKMIQLSGLTVQDTESPDGDIAIEVTGLRPGEKLYDELLIGNNPTPTVHSRIMKSHEAFIELAELEVKLASLEAELNINDAAKVRQLLQQIVLDYAPTGGVVDWVYMAGH
jgi:FlaA1/EpsC-like NDP-sugar epimerase